MNDIKDDLINAPKINAFKKKIFFYKKIYKNRKERDKLNSIQFLTKKTVRFNVDKRGDYKKKAIK